MRDSKEDAQPKVQLVVFKSTSKNPLSKKFHLDDDGKLVKVGGGKMATGKYKVKDAPDPETFVKILGQLSCSHATGYGLPKDGSTKGIIVTKDYENVKDGIARTRENFIFSSGPSWMMFDIDMPDMTIEKVKEHFSKTIPGFEHVPAVFGHSSSSFIYKDNLCLVGEGGKRVYILVKDGQDIIRSAKIIADRLKLNGTLHYNISKSGMLLEKCLIDEAVYQPERLDFSGRPYLLKPLQQKRPQPEIQNNDAPPFDTKTAISDLTEQEVKSLKALRTFEKEKVADKATAQEEIWTEERVQEQEKKAGRKLSDKEKKSLRMDFKDATRRRSLHEDFILYSETDGPVTVAEVLKDPERWHEKKFADPLEPDYNNDKRIATVYLKNIKRPMILSFAHGGQRFILGIKKKELDYKTGELPKVVKECIEVMKGTGTVFESNKELVRVSSGEKYIVTEPWLRNTLDTYIAFKKEKMTKDGPEFKMQDCPGELAKRMLASVGEWSFNELDKIVSLPVMRKDWSILSEPGYDPTTKLILLNGDYRSIMQTIPEKPCIEDVKKALERIWHPFRYFPFKNEIDRGVFLSAVLTIAVRSSLSKAPGWLFKAPVYGTGKTKLAECIGEMTNKLYTMMSWPDEQAEQRKTTTAELRRGPEVIIFDNIVGTWSSPDLARIFTSGLHSDRVLGKTEMVDFKVSCLIMGTGNNVIVGGDLARRVLVCELDPQEERPDKRDFPFDPVVETQKNALRMRADVLTVLKGYQHAGCPRITKDSFGSFEDWDKIVRQTVCWIGENKLLSVDIGDPVESITASFQEDPNTQKLRAFLINTYEKFRDKPFTARELVSSSKPSMYDSCQEINEDDDCLYSALWNIAGQGKIINTRILGRWLSRNADRIIIGLKVVKGSLRSGHQTYSVQCIEPGGFGGFSGSVSHCEKINSEKKFTDHSTEQTHLTHQTHYTDPPVDDCEFVIN